tara:strand:+ start:103 stop:708 length:606 start_codon:yes stop_codon:yes gene_type:complete
MYYAIGELIKSITEGDKEKKKELIRRLGYKEKNIGKGCNKLDRLACEGTCTKAFRELLISSLCDDPEIVRDAFEETRKQQWKERTDYERSVFKPHLYTINEHKRPTQITMCAVAGGERLKIIDLQEHIADQNWASQQEIVRKRIKQGVDQGRVNSTSFYGKVKGYIYRKTYDDAFRFDLNGNFVEKCDFEDFRGGDCYVTL